MWRLASLSVVAEPFVFIITLPDLFAVGLIALITAPGLLAKATATIRTDKSGIKYTRTTCGSTEVLTSLYFKLNSIELIRFDNGGVAVFHIILLTLSFVLDHFLREEVCTESLLQ